MTAMVGRFGVAVAALFCGALMMAGQAAADDSDDMFIQELRQAGLNAPNPSARQTAIAIAKDTCTLLGSGYTNNEASNIISQKTSNPVDVTMTIMGVGALHYCPELMG